MNILALTVDISHPAKQCPNQRGQLFCKMTLAASIAKLIDASSLLFAVFLKGTSQTKEICYWTTIEVSN